MWQRLLDSSMLPAMIRASSMATKFFLVIALAKWRGLEASAQLAQLQSVVFVGSFLIGFDLYVSNARRQGGALENSWSLQLTGQILFSAIVALIVIILSPVLGIALRYVPLASLILLTDWVGQETERIMVLRGQQGRAQLSFFLRNTIWPVVAIIGIIWRDAGVGWLLFCWSISSVLSSSFGLWAAKFRPQRIAAVAAWFYKVIPGGMVIFVGAFHFIAIQNIDKVLSTALLPPAVAGAYSVISISSTLSLTAIFSLAQFRWLRDIMSGETVDFRRFRREVALAAVLFGGGGWMLASLFLIYQGQTPAADLAVMAGAQLLSLGITAWSVIDHYKLLAMKMDKGIAIVALTSLCLMFPLMFVYREIAAYAAAPSTVATVSLISALLRKQVMRLS